MKEKDKILFFRIGQLGDIIISLPAFWAIRSYFHHANISLLCDYHPNKNYVLAKDLLESSPLFNDYLLYPAEEISVFRRVFNVFRLAFDIKKRGYKTLVYLAPSRRTRWQVFRDYCFFRLIGIKNFIGIKGFSKPAFGQENKSLREADILLSKLSICGIPVPTLGKGKMDLCIERSVYEKVDHWLKERGVVEGRKLVAFGPGSKMPSKIWPLENYAELGRLLIHHFDIYPLVFGGPEDCSLGQKLLVSWGKGINAAGVLSLKEASVTIQRCSLYVGNDTGTMHLAAAAGTKCVAIFSSRDIPGKWDPYGSGHIVLRKRVPCEGCLLEKCPNNMECIKLITVKEVFNACATIISGMRSEEVKENAKTI